MERNEEPELLSNKSGPEEGILLSFPDQMIALIDEKIAPLWYALRGIATAYRIPEPVIEEIVGGVPDELLAASAFRNRLTEQWEYVYGPPLSGPDGRVGYGHHNCIAVDKLLSILFLVRRRLNDNERHTYLRRLADPINHVNVLTEFVPVMRVDPVVPAFFSVKGFGTQGKDIDWRIVPASGPEILLEQKNRLGIMAEELAKLDAALLSGAQEIPKPDHDPARLFLSIEHKFEAASPSDQLQGAWIHLWYKEKEEALRDAFEARSPDLIHFAILADWNEDVYLMARQGVNCDLLLSTLGVTTSNRILES